MNIVTLSREEVSFVSGGGIYEGYGKLCGAFTGTIFGTLFGSVLARGNLVQVGTGGEGKPTMVRKQSSLIKTAFFVGPVAFGGGLVGSYVGSLVGLFVDNVLEVIKRDKIPEA